MSYIGFGGEYYVINFDAIEILLSGEKYKNNDIQIIKKITSNFNCDAHTGAKTLINVIEEVEEQEKGREIDISKFEMLREMIDVILHYDVTIDDTLGIKRGLKSVPLSYKFAFNTLLHYDIISKVK